VLDHWFGILAMRAAATKNGKIQEGALKRYVGSGRVPTGNARASGSFLSGTDVLIAL
jgi:hypothetical protein